MAEYFAESEVMSEKLVISCQVAGLVYPKAGDVGKAGLCERS